MNLYRGVLKGLLGYLTNEFSKRPEIVFIPLRDDSLLTIVDLCAEINERVKYVNLKIKLGFNPFLILTFYKILKEWKLTDCSLPSESRKLFLPVISIV